MNVLIVSAEFGIEGGGLSLSCEKTIGLLSDMCNTRTTSSTTFPIQTAAGGYSKRLSSAIQYEYKLKEDCVLYSNSDIVIGFGGGFNGYYASLLSVRINARFILCLRGSDINLCKWDAEQKWLTTQACKKASNIICLSTEMTENVKELDNDFLRKTQIIPNFYSIEPPKVVFPNIPFKVVIGCGASHLNEKKGIANILNMAAEFKQISDIPIHIELAGFIDEDLKEQYSIIAKELYIDKNVKFLGYIQRDNMPLVMKNWDFYIQGSVCEGHPNIIMECISMGKAFVSTKTGYVAESLSKDYPSLFFDSFAPQQMASQLLSLINTPKIEQVYDTAFNTMVRLCSVDAIKNQWESLLKGSNQKLKSLPLDNIITVGLHDVQGDEHDSITTPQKVFQEFVELVHNQGYFLCSMKDYLHKEPEERNACIVCTFDDGYESLINVVLPILNKYGYTATVFICTSLLGHDNSWNNKDGRKRNHLTAEAIQTLQENGWEIGSHGVTHRNLLKLNDLELYDELSHSKRELCGLCDCDIQSYAYPYGANNTYIQSCVSKHYEYAFSVEKGGTNLVSDRYQIRRYSISEIYKMICTK